MSAIWIAVLGASLTAFLNKYIGHSDGTVAFVFVAVENGVCVGKEVEAIRFH